MKTFGEYYIEQQGQGGEMDYNMVKMLRAAKGGDKNAFLRLQAEAGRGNEQAKGYIDELIQPHIDMTTNKLFSKAKNGDQDALARLKNIADSGDYYAISLLSQMPSGGQQIVGMRRGGSFNPNPPSAGPQSPSGTPVNPIVGMRRGGSFNPNPSS